MNSTDKFDMTGPMRGWRMRADIEAERERHALSSLKGVPNGRRGARYFLTSGHSLSDNGLAASSAGMVAISL
jgi:hypothetical protein